MTLTASDAEPPKRGRAAAAAHAVGAWLGGVVGAAMQQPLAAALPGALAAVGAVLSDGAFRALLALVTLLCAFSLLAIVAGGRRHRRVTELIKLHADDLLERDEQLRRAQQEQVYSDVPTEIVKGLNYALADPTIASRGITHYVERNALKTMADTFAAAHCDETGVPSRVEIGIVTQQGERFTATHGSGPYTEALKSEGPCFANGMPIREVLRIKAASDFTRGGYQLVELERGGPAYLFALSTAPLGDAETRALQRLAAMVALIEVALANFGLES